jgi:hypothetical protein
MAAREVGGGAAGSPLAGERVPHEGERAAVERFHRGAFAPVPRAGERRRSGEHSTRSVHPHSVHQGNAGSGGGKVRPW